MNTNNRKNIFEMTDSELSGLTDAEVKEKAYMIRNYSLNFYDGDIARAGKVLQILGVRLSAIEAAEYKIVNTPENQARLDSEVSRVMRQVAEQDRADRDA